MVCAYVYILLFLSLSARQPPYVHPISDFIPSVPAGSINLVASRPFLLRFSSNFIFRVCLLTGASEINFASGINFDPENRMRHYVIFDLADQPRHVDTPDAISIDLRQPNEVNIESITNVHALKASSLSGLMAMVRPRFSLFPTYVSLASGFSIDVCLTLSTNHSAFTRNPILDEKGRVAHWIET
jgi:hypothetical protein